MCPATPKRRLRGLTIHSFKQYWNLINNKKQQSIALVNNNNKMIKIHNAKKLEKNQ